MDAKDIELLKSIIETAIKVGFEKSISGMVPFGWVALIVSGLVAGIGVTWAWGLNQSKKATDKIAQWAEKIETLSNAQRDRDDTREKEIRERYTVVIDRLKDEQLIEKKELNVRITRLENSRDAAKLQYENSLQENGEILGARLIQCETALNENNEHLEAVSILLEKGIDNA